MRDQELEFHVHKLEEVFNAAPRSKRSDMRPGIQRMIRTLKADNKRVPLSLRRIQRRMEQDNEDDFFDNMPV